MSAASSNVPVREGFPLTEALIDAHADALGVDLTGYRHHVCRVLNFYLALTGQSRLPESVRIAAAFHDLAIWTAHTFDYLEPSVRLAAEHLRSIQQPQRLDEVAALIRAHHKLRPYRDAPADTVEAFRRADLVDVSLGLVRCGLPRAFIREVQARFPAAGFHRRLLQLTARQFLRTPWCPLPMMRW